ncbi:DUF4296 domain-containing protein [Litoribaculum gwangyangense]|jgi:hypothetical protein|uniref:DUF4296 domain-containing protein n=1 Tax=Litoribaculum gwangyangense TaxID=1130722 RepID=A0ABP9C8P4_9FLAO
MILKRFISYISIVLTLVACNRFNGPEKPDNLIPKEKMIDILIDDKLISSASTVNKMILKNSGIDLDTYIFTKYNIDSLQFVLSNNYYAFHIKDYEEIYNKVEDSLEMLKTKYKDLEAQEWKEKTKREEDSLKAALAKELDTLSLKDSLKKEIIKDSLDKTTTFKKFEAGTNLIPPVSDTGHQ